MSIVHGLAKSIGGFLFVTLLGLAILSIALANLTDYANLKGPITDLFAATMTVQSNTNQSNQSAEILDGLKSECMRLGSPTINQSIDNTSMTLNCTEINTIESSDVYKLVAGSFVDQIYHTDYNCSYIDCLQSNMSFESKVMVALISNKAHEFYISIIIYLLVIAALGGIMLAWGAGSVPGALKSFGWSFVVIGMGYFFLTPIGSIIPAPAEAQAAISSLLKPLFTVMSQYFLYSLVAGIVILSAGYGMKFLTKRKK